MLFVPAISVGGVEESVVGATMPWISQSRLWVVHSMHFFEASDDVLGEEGGVGG